MRKRTKILWGLAFAAAVVLVGLRVYLHQRPLFSATEQAITAANAAELGRVGRLRLDGNVRFDNSGQWILGTHIDRVIGIRTADRRQGFEVLNNAQCTGVLNFTCNALSNYGMNATSLARVSPNGRYFAAYWANGQNQGLNIWDMHSGDLLATQSSQTGTRVLAYTPDSSALVFDIFGTGLWAYDFSADDYRRLDADDPLRLLASSQGIYYQTNTHIRRVENLNVVDVARVDIVPGLTPYISPDGRFVVGQNLNSFEMEMVELATRRRATLEAHGSRLFDVAFSPDGTTLATADFSGIVALWDLERGELMHRFVGSGTGAHNLAFTRNGDVLFASNYYNIRGYDTSSGRTLFEDTLADRAYGISISPDGRYLLVESGRVYGVAG